MLFLLPFWSPLEKLSIAKSYKYLENSPQPSTLYDSGVGEEYLASLVKSSNESATGTPSEREPRLQIYAICYYIWPKVRKSKVNASQIR
nr:hypothetical protein [Shigella sonnei]